MKKKILIFCLCAIALFVSVGGTVAYIVTANETNTQKKVEIIQHKMKRTSEGLVPYTNEDTAFPGVYNDEFSYQEVDLVDYYPNGTIVNFWSNVHNSLDRIVSVQNKGSESVYVRTVFAFDKSAHFRKNYVTKIDETDVWQWDNLGEITINNKPYELYEAVYLLELNSNSYTYPSLLEIVVGKDLEIEKIENINLYVTSQAVSVDNIDNQDIVIDTTNKSVTEATLDAVLGEITTNNHPFKK